MKNISEMTTRGRRYYLVRVNGKSKTFSIDKLGEKQARRMAERWRDSVKLNLVNEYTIDQKKRSEYTLSYAYGRSCELYVHSAGTRRKHDAVFGKYFAGMENIQLAKIRAKDILEHYNRYISCSQDVLNRIHTVWVQMFKAGILDEAIVTNYASVVEIPKSQAIHTVRRRFAESSEIVQVIMALLNDVSRTEHSRFIGRLIAYAILIISETGMRPAECYALTRQSFDFDKKLVVYGNRVGTDENRVSIIVKPKTEKSFRVNPITERLEAIARSLMEFNPAEYLFTDDTGRLLNSDIVATRIGNVNRRLGTDFRMYQLRHNFVRDMVNSESNQRTIMDLLGHANYSQTLDYTESTIEQRRIALEKAGR